VEYDLNLTYNALKLAVKESGEITADYFDAAATDTDGESYEVTVSILLGNQTAGSTLTIRLSATGKYNVTKTLNIGNVKVYGNPTIPQYDNTINKIKEKDILNAGYFVAAAQDYFGTAINCTVEIIDGEQTAGDTLTVRISATDASGNIVYQDIEGIEVYGTPTFDYDSEKTSIKSSDILNSAFQFQIRL